MGAAPRVAAGWYRQGPGSSWAPARASLHRAHLELSTDPVPPAGPAAPATPPSGPPWRVPLGEIRRVDELHPGVEGVVRVELSLIDGVRVELALPPDFVHALCARLESRRMRPRVSARSLVAAGMAAVLVGGTLAVWQQGGQSSAGAQPTTTSSSTTTTTTTTSTTTTTVAPTTTTTSTTTTTTTTMPPVELAAAPLTGLPVEAWRVRRPAIVSKIDGAIPAMPPVGLDRADVVIEVRIEYGYSRYLGVWHSQDPPVIGPHRSARTTDVFLLSMFGTPIFAYSGANPKVLDALARTPWKLDAPPGRAPDAYYRDELRPRPHDLFARTDALRRGRGTGPEGWPHPLFHHRPLDTPVPGVPVGGFVAAAGPPAQFTWDPALDGWRRWVHNREHLHANGLPVAPANVVVLETTYVQSHADERSPEAVSLGLGRAWVFSQGAVTAGWWSRTDHTQGFQLVDPLGGPMTLRPGTTWVVVGEGAPEIQPPG